MCIDRRKLLRKFREIGLSWDEIHEHLGRALASRIMTAEHSCLEFNEARLLVEILGAENLIEVMLISDLKLKSKLQSLVL